MTRREELLKVIDNDVAFIPLIDEMVFLENQLTELRELPFIKINPKNPSQQKSTPAQKQYKELLQQYTNILKVVARVGDNDGDNKESLLRKWVKSHIGGD